MEAVAGMVAMVGTVVGLIVGECMRVVQVVMVEEGLQPVIGLIVVFAVFELAVCLAHFAALLGWMQRC